ncbi:MAG: VOC family protein, partial [Bryobacteraceae bacterium]|nr:VOC family protein [Bryobacteraceae bacterium]
ADEFAAKAAEHQGKVVVAPFDAPGVGRMAVISDPQGVKFSVIALKLPDAA